MKQRSTMWILLSLAAIFGSACMSAEETEDVSVEIGETQQALVNWATSGSVTDAAPAFGARFGRNVSMSGDLIGVTRQALSATDLGTTQVFRRNTSGGWTREFNQTTPVDRFPVVAVGARWIFVGEPCGAPTAGCKGRVLGYWRYNNEWRWMAQINYADQAWDFGRALAWDDPTNTLAVVDGNKVRTYYVNYNSFVPLAEINPPASAYSNIAFGASIAVSGTSVAVGAPSGTRWVGSTAYRSPGYVYLFDRNGTAQATLTGVGLEKSDTASGFGTDVSLSANGNRLAVAADQEVGRSLTAYVFTRSTTGAWNLGYVVPPAAGVSGGSVYVAVDSYLTVSTRAPDSATQGQLRMFELGRFGYSQSGTFALGSGWAPVDTSGARVIAGQPNFWGDVGSAMTYYGSQPVIQFTQLSSTAVSQ